MIATQEELRDQALRVEEALRQVLERQEAWHCNRVWEAWAVDTMSRDDFSLVTEDPVAVEELVQAAMSALGVDGVEHNAATPKIVYCPIHGDLLAATRSYRCENAPKDHEHMCSRAAVPDAATEIARNLANATALTGQDARVIAEAAVMVAAAGEIAEDHARCDGRLLSVEKHAERMEAERDAALAAVERVRVIHARDEYGLCVECSWEYPETSYDALSNDVSWPCSTIQALDGAPEPEAWHYGRSWTGTRLEDECPCAKQSCGLVTLTDAETADCGQHAVKYSKTMRQSHSSSNCPGKPHDEHVKVTECWPMDCIEGDCDHRDEFGEPEGLESCPRTPMEVCVECMVAMGGGHDPERWEEHLPPWPCSKTVLLPVEGESKP